MLKGMDLNELYLEEDKFKTIDDSIKEIKESIRNNNENFEIELEDMLQYKNKFGGDCTIAWMDGNNDMDFIGYIFIKNNKIIDVVEYI